MICLYCKENQTSPNGVDYGTIFYAQGVYNPITEDHDLLKIIICDDCMKLHNVAVVIIKEEV